MLIKSNHNSCLGCAYLIKEGDCSWFVRPKAIPHDIIKKGCKHQIPRIKVFNSNRIAFKIIEAFKGELI